MPDITMCRTRDCPKKECCYRHKAKPDEVSMIALIAYAYKEEKDEKLQEWFVDFFKRNNTYIRNQMDNFVFMRNDLNRFIQKGCVA